MSLPTSSVGRTISIVRVLAVATVVAISVAPSDGGAQGFNVHDFSCVSGNTLGVNIDIRGLGNTNLCVVSSVNQSLDCACVGGGGNCPTDAKKQNTNITATSAEQLEPKNGRVDTTVNVTATPTSEQCQLSCPSGQTSRLIQFEASGTFKVCAVDDGDTCSPTYCDSRPLLAGPINCGPTGEVVFAGRRNNCVQLFP
jgi:hypothetical protein